MVAVSTGNKNGFDVVLLGFNDTLKALRSASRNDPEAGVIRKNMFREFRAAGNIVRDRARVLIPQRPMSRWRNTGPSRPTVGWTSGGQRKRGGTVSRGGSGWPAWNVGQISAGLKVSLSGRRRPGEQIAQLVTVLNTSPAGSIFEVAGRTNRGNSPQGIQFIKNLDESDRASRLIWEAYDRSKSVVDKAVIEAAEKAENELSELLMRADDRMAA